MKSKTSHLSLYKYMLFLAMGNHLITGLSSAFLTHDILLVSQNIFSFLFFGCMQLYWNKHKTTSRLFTIIFLCVMELLLQVSIAGYYLGWGAGFQNFCFITFTVSFLNIFESSRTKSKLHYKVIHLTSVTVYIFLVLHNHFGKPVKVLPEEQLELIRVINSALIFFIAMFLSSVFSARYKSSIRKLKRFADIDELTQLYNRHAIRSKFDEAKKYLIENKINFGICILDIDDFKLINDSYGHNIGDDVLSEISKILKAAENETVSVCRWGGEEFLIIDQYGKNKDEFISRIDTIRKSISDLTFLYPDKNIRFSITVTAGCSFSESNLEIHELIDQADNRLYKGKNSGKNKTVFSDN